MKVEFTPCTKINGNPVSPDANMFEVAIDGEFWGFVDGPVKGQRTGRKTAWMSIRGEIVDGVKRVNPASWWNQGHPNQHAAVLAEL